MKKIKLNLNDLYVADYNSLYSEPEDDYDPIYRKAYAEDRISKWYIDETQFYIRAPRLA